MALCRINQILQHDSQMGNTPLMQRFGIPTIFASQWIDFLSTMKRILLLKGTLSKPHESVCGVPEGDPLSVVLSVMIS